MEQYAGGVNVTNRPDRGSESNPDSDLPDMPHMNLGSPRPNRANVAAAPDLKAAVEADRKARIEMCNTELEVLLKKYRCSLAAYMIQHQGQGPVFPIQIVAVD